MNITGPDSIVEYEVLIVDDTIDNLELLTEILSGAGYKVHPSGSGESALRIVKEKLPALIILDINMPGMDGFEVCRRLKANAETSSIPVIFLSGLGDELSKIKGFEIGAVDYINKPFNIREVLARVKAHLTINHLKLNLERQNARLLKEIAERKKAEEVLLESEERFRGIIDQTHAGYFFIDREGCFQHVNSAWLRMHGHDSADAVIGRHFLLTQVEADIEESRQRVEMMLTGGSIPAGEFSRRCRDGSVGYHTLSAHPVIQTGKIVGLEGFIIDITEHKRAEAEKAELEAQNRQLQKAESLRIMAGAIAHHFNNQLQVVMGNLEMALDDLPGASITTEVLNEAMKAGRKAAEVSGLMLTYLGQTPGEHESINLSEACGLSLTLLQAAAPKGMILKADFPASGPVIRANAGQIQQVLTNLVYNAWEATGENRGAICISVKTVSHANIPASNRFPIDWKLREIDYACLEVSDMGCGIANKDIEKIFDPFFSSKFTGRGLGLPVVLGIVRAHGGAVTVESELGRGSVFRVFLPVSAETISLQQEKTASVPKFEGGGAMLLVEDQGPVRHLAKKMLIRLGFTVFEAKDGLEAVEMFKQHQNEIRWVLSDLTMPHMDGWDMLAALRKLSPDIPVILSSGYDEAKVMADEHTERPNAFLGKPYQINKLSDTVFRVLS